MSALPQPAEKLSPPLEPTPLATRDDWIPVAVLAVVAVLNAIGLLLVVRRLLDALTAPLPMWPLFATALVATIAAKFARIAWRTACGFPGSRRERILDRVVGWGSSLGLILLALGSCYPGYRNGEWLTWLPMLIADQFWRQNFFDNGTPGLALADLPYDEPPVCGLAPEEIDVKLQAAGQEEQLLQQLFRVRDAEGYEVVYGTVRADFVAGQRHATVHAGFCPPLSTTPIVEADACNWPEARVKVVQALPHGVRLDVRLSEPAEEACFVPIDLAASPVGEASDGRSTPTDL